MKKIFCFIAFTALSMAMLCSCNDSDSSSSDEGNAGADYLVMMYGVGGGNLDKDILANIMQAIDEGADDKVKMTFEFKASKDIQDSAVLANFHGVRRFTCEDNAELKGTFPKISKDYPSLDKDAQKYYWQHLKSESIGGADYDMTRSEALADFIKWSKEKYPKAKRTILVLSNHGGGWNIHTDGKTRAILYDDNVKDAHLTAQDAVDGINGGGGVDMLYTDACFMSMYENLYTYAKGARYVLTSVEGVPDKGGDYRKLLSLLKNAGTTEENMENAIHRYIDHCTSKDWWEAKGDTEEGYADIGLFDLSKLSILSPTLKKIADTMAEKFSSTESIQPAKEDLPLEDHFAPYIRMAVNNCTASSRDSLYPWNSIPNVFKPYFLKLAEPKRDPEEPDDPDLYIPTSIVIRWLRYADSDDAKEAYEKYPDDWKKLTTAVISRSKVTFPLTDLLRNLNNELNEVGAKNNPFSQLREELIAGLKSMAYISCTKFHELPGIDQAYELSSPGIVIVPFNENYKSIYNKVYSQIEDYNVALRYYQASDFDKAIGWSKFLQRLDVCPSILFNPGRWELRGIDN